MPKIPTILADSGLKSTQLPEAPLTAFTGQGGEAIGQGLQQFGAAATHAAINFADIEQKKQLDAAHEWSTTETSALQRNLSTFWRDNYQTADFDARYQQYADSLLKDAYSRAPSDTALKLFRGSNLPDVDRNLGRAKMQAEETRIGRRVEAVKTSTADALSAFRDLYDVSPELATQNLLSYRSTANDGVSTSWDGLAPELARKVRAEINYDMALGVARLNPDLARRILADSKDIEEQRREALTTHIDQLEYESNAEYRADYLQRMQNVVRLGAETGTDIPDISAAEVKQVFGKNYLTHLNWFREARETVNKSHAIVNEYRGMNPVFVQRKLDELQAFGLNTSGSDALKLARPLLEKKAEIAHADPSKYVQSENPFVRDAFARVATLPPDQQAAAFQRATQLNLQFQGYAPADAPEMQRAYYLNRPTNDRHVLTIDEANEIAGKVRMGTASEGVNALLQKMIPYGDNSDIVFSDLVNLPRKDLAIPQSMELGLISGVRRVGNGFVRQWWLDAYLAAQNNPQTHTGAPDKSAALYWEALDNNPTWKAWRADQIGDLWQRSEQVDGYRVGILNFAKAIASKGKGMNEKTAVKAATDLLFASVGLVQTDKQDFIIPRERGPGLPDRTDAELDDLGRRLPITLRQIRPENVKLYDDFGNALFPNAMPLQTFDDSDPQKWQLLRNFITANGIFRTQPDHQSVSVFIRGDAGLEFQLLDKNNEPYVIRFDDLPSYQTRRTYRPLQGGIMGAWDADLKMLPEKEYRQGTYPMTETTREWKNNFQFGSGKISLGLEAIPKSKPIPIDESIWKKTRRTPQQLGEHLNQPFQYQPEP